MGNGAWRHPDSAAAWRLRLSGCAVLLLLLVCVNLGFVMCQTKTILRQTSVAESAKGDQFRRLEALGPMRFRRLLEDSHRLVRTCVIFWLSAFAYGITTLNEDNRIGLDESIISDLYERPTDWAIYIFPYTGLPQASYQYRGTTIPITPVGEGVQLSACYDIPHTSVHTGEKTNFIFSFSSKMERPRINGRSVPEGKKGVFLLQKDNWEPLERFHGLIHAWRKPTKEQPIKSHLVTFDGASPKTDFILEYEMAPPSTTALLPEKGYLKTTDENDLWISQLKMTSTYLPDLTYTYGCQPAIPPGYTLRRLKVLDGNQTLFNSEVEQENLPFVLRIRHGSSNIRYGVDDRQEPIPQTSTTDQKPVDQNPN